MSCSYNRKIYWTVFFPLIIVKLWNTEKHNKENKYHLYFVLKRMFYCQYFQAFAEGSSMSFPLRKEKVYAKVTKKHQKLYFPN